MKIKKFLKIILIAFVSIIILILGFIGYVYLKQEYEISRLPDYYRELAKECRERERGGFGCCMTSVENMARGNYKFAPETGCPEGFQVNRLKCIASYTWCEPEK